MAHRGTGDILPDRDVTRASGPESCPSCGATNNADAAFCSQCGFDLGLDPGEELDFEEFEEGLEDEGPEPHGFEEDDEFMEDEDLLEAERLLDDMRDEGPRRVPPPGPPGRGPPGPVREPGRDMGRRDIRSAPEGRRRMPPPDTSARGAARPEARVPPKPAKPATPIDYKVKRETVMSKFTMYIVILGLVNYALGFGIGKIMVALKFGARAFLGNVLLNIIVMGILIGIGVYASRMSDKSSDKTTPVESKNLGRVYGGIGIMLIIFLIQVFGVHRAVPGIPDPGNYNSEWSILYVLILLPGIVLMIKGLYGIREKHSYYKIWKNGIWLLLLAPMTGAIDSMSPAVMEYGRILNNQSYFSFSVSAMFMIMAVLAFMLKGYLGDQYRSLDEETKRGEDLFKAGRYREAMQRFDNAIDIGHDLFSQYFYDPDTPRIQVRLPAQYGIPWLRKGDVLIQMNRPRKAIAIYDVILELDPKNEVVWNRKGEVLLSMGKFDDAIRCFDSALAAVPTYAKATQNKQKAVARKKEEDEDIIVIE
jgi:hypothetical protein